MHRAAKHYARKLFGHDDEDHAPVPEPAVIPPSAIAQSSHEVPQAQPKRSTLQMDSDSSAGSNSDGD